MHIGLVIQENPTVINYTCLTAVLDFLAKDNTMSFKLSMFLFWIRGFMS